MKQGSGALCVLHMKRTHRPHSGISPPPLSHFAQLHIKINTDNGELSQGVDGAQHPKVQPKCWGSCTAATGFTGSRTAAQIGTALLAKTSKQTNQAQACSSTSVIMKIKKYFDFSFWVFPQLLCSRSCASLVLSHFRDVKLLFPGTQAVTSHYNMDYSKAFGARKEP